MRQKHTPKTLNNTNNASWITQYGAWEVSYCINFWFEKLTTQLSPLNFLKSLCWFHIIYFVTRGIHGWRTLFSTLLSLSKLLTCYEEWWLFGVMTSCILTSSECIKKKWLIDWLIDCFKSSKKEKKKKEVKMAC